MSNQTKSIRSVVELHCLDSYCDKHDIDAVLEGIAEVVEGEKMPHEGSKCNCDWNKALDHISKLILGGGR